jgi:hypothetical protein
LKSSTSKGAETESMMEEDDDLEKELAKLE